MSFLSRLFAKPEPPAPEKSPSRFRRDAAAFAARLQAWRPLLPSAPSGPRVAVLVSPWLSTAVPFFSLECALALAHSGHQVTILWDAAEIVGNIPDKKHPGIISSLFPSLPPWLEIVHVAAALPQLSPEDAAPARRIVYENAVRNVRGEMNVAAFFAAHPEAEAGTCAHFGRIRAVLAAGHFQWLLLPGGIFGVSAVYLELARQAGLPFSTFDSGPGRLRLVHDGVAAHLADLPAAARLIAAELTPAQKDTALRTARAELERRTQGRDDRTFQVTASSGQQEKCDLLIPLNIRWDSAALGRQRLFASVEENIAAILEWAASRPEITVCIRQHPNERRPHLRGSDDWSTLVARFAHLGARIRWIAAADPVNTYDLIRSARAILPHTSTVGIEAALLGAPVILSTQVYYQGFSFVWNPVTRADFFAHIEAALRRELVVTEPAREEAALIYFLTQQCAAMLTGFTPQNDDYASWSSLPPLGLWSLPEPADFLQALLTRTPLAAVRARRLLAA